MLKLELISPVQITVCPVSTTPGSAVLINPEVLLDRGRQIARVIPQQTPTDAHSRRDEVPQIPLSDYINAAVELTAVDRPDYISECRKTTSVRSKCVPTRIDPGVFAEPVKKPLGLHKNRS